MRKLMMVVALAAAPAVAQEPLSLFGIPFNEPLTLPECPWREVRDYMSRDRKATKREYSNTTFSEALCYTQHPNIGQSITDGTVSFIFPLRERPSMGGVGGRLVDGRLQLLNIHTRGVSTQASDLEALSDKFGPPAHLERPTVQNRMGASFDTIEATWSLPGGASAAYLSTMSTIDNGRVIIATPEGRAAQTAADEEYQRKRAGRQL